MRAAALVAVVALASLAACGGDEGGVRVERATPPYGPVIGGTRVVIEGGGFDTTGAGNRVQIGGREAPLVATVDDATLEVVVPPGDRPGDAEIVVISGDRLGRAAGVFRYSAPPTITAIEPADVLFSAIATRVTVTGSGFADEGAGEVVVTVDGTPVAAEVESDTRLGFIVPPGRALLEPDVQVIDDRGRALRRRAFRYAPSRRPGLLLFPRTGLFAIFVDPREGTHLDIPWVAGATIRFSAVVRDDDGAYWALDRARRWGRLDMKTQRLEALLPVQGWMPTVIRTGHDLFALDRNAARFGRFDPGSGVFTPIGDAQLTCCGSYGLAFDGTTYYFTARSVDGAEINTVDPVTGAVGTPVPLLAPAGYAVEEMRFLDGTLYATSRDGFLTTIDPRTGVVTQLPITPGRVPAMELFVPR